MNIDGMQFDFMPGKGTKDALFIFRGAQKEYGDKKGSCTYAFCGCLIEFHQR